MLFIYLVAWCCGSVGAGSDYDYAMLGSRRNGTQCVVGATYGASNNGGGGLWCVQSIEAVGYGVCNLLP